MKAISIVPDFGQVRAGRLGRFDYRAFTTRARRALAAAGIDRYLLALDATFNHVRGSGLRGHWQLHYYGVVLEGASLRIDELKNLINASGRVHIPVQISTAPIQPRSIRPVTAYAVKSRFKRRENVLKSRPGRSPFWDTQERPLLGLRLVELLVFLDRIGLHGRLLTRGIDFANLQRAHAIRASRQRAKRRQKSNRSRRAKKGGCPPLTAWLFDSRRRTRVRSPHGAVRT
jgi:hypothetical protein